MPSVAHPESRYAPFVGRAAPRTAQGGFAFMVVLVGLVLGSLSFYLENLNQAVSPTLQADKTRQALAEAKEILIGWAAESEINHNGPGHLPCPDNDNNGHGDGAACGPESRLGRFPWKTLNAPDLRDASGERLWYAVSPNFLNKATNPINSDTKGVFRITGGTEVDEVIAIIFAPGPVLAGQDRSTNEARKNRANYLEDSNFDDDVFASSFNDEESNDRMTFITAADLYPAVERKVAERMQTSIVPVLHYYLAKWVDANDDANQNTTPAKRLPFAATFDPSAASGDSCGESGQSRGMLPLGYCSDGLTVSWSSDTSRTRSKVCTESVGANDTLATIDCTVVFRKDDDDDDDDEYDDCDGDGSMNKRVKATIQLKGVGQRTLAMPLHKTDVEHPKKPRAPTKNGDSLTNFTMQSAKLADGNIQIAYDGRFKVSECVKNQDELTMTVSFPLYRADTVYANNKIAAIDADAGLGVEEKKRQKQLVDPAWFFDNGWHRLTYYAASGAQLPACSDCADTLTVQRTQGVDSTTVHALLMLAGRATTYKDELAHKRLQTRPNNTLANYFESINRDVESSAFQQASSLQSVNDRIVSICPWTPNPYRPEDVQECP